MSANDLLDSKHEDLSGFSQDKREYICAVRKAAEEVVASLAPHDLFTWADLIDCLEEAKEAVELQASLMISKARLKREVT